MEKEWSSKWKSSTQRRKQRKYRINAPIHIKKKFLGCHLSESLHKKYGKRAIVVRKGDIVEIQRGNFSGKKGKVEAIDTKKGKIFVEGIKRKKVDGTEISVPVQASNLMITELNVEDSSRFKKAKLKEKAEKKG